MKLYYYLLWAFTALWVLLQEVDILPSYYLPHTAQLNYLVTLLCIVTSIGGSWLAYKLFSFKSVKAQLKQSQAKVKRWLFVRFLLIVVAIVPSVFFYYAGGYGETALYCFLIALIMSLLCFPRKV